MLHVGWIWLGASSKDVSKADVWLCRLTSLGKDLVLTYGQEL